MLACLVDLKLKNPLSKEAFWTLFESKKHNLTLFTVYKRLPRLGVYSTNWKDRSEAKSVYSTNSKDRSGANSVYSTHLEDQSEAKSVYSTNSKDRNGANSAYSRNRQDRSEKKLTGSK